MTFKRQLEVGKVGESLIAKWVMSRGSAVLPVYEIEKASGKGPQLFVTNGGHVAPDMVAFTSNGVVWIEAKHKSVFSWHRKTQQWTTGIDLRHYFDYLKVAQQTKLPVWLMFFHRDTSPSAADVRGGCPKACPVGLFGGDIAHLSHVENHRSLPIDAGRHGFLGHGRSGMVYWAHKDLRRLATLDEMIARENPY